VSWLVIGPHGKHFGYRGWTRVESASTLKVMFLVAYLRQPSVRDRDLRQWERDLLAPMIKRSDNVAATRVDDMLGPQPMYHLAHDAGMRSFHFVMHPWGASTVTAADMAPFMFHLERFIPDRHERYAKYLLSHVTASQRWGVGRLHFPNWRRYFKGGWGSGSGAVEHQVVLLERGDLRVAAAVMITSSPSHEYAKETLEGVFRRLLPPLPTS
jgi:Beta-lactamase enzyme family